MEKDIQQFERIRSYIQGKMSVADAAAFERDLLQDKDLNAEYEMLRDISQAAKDISEEELRSMLAKAEKEAQSNPIVVDKKIINAELNQIEKELRDIYGIEDSVPKWHKRFLNKLKAWFLPDAYDSAENNQGQSLINMEQQGSTVGLSYSLRLAISFAVVACLAIAIVIPHNAHLANAGFDFAPSSITLPLYRAESDELLDNAIESYNSGNYQEAESFLEEAENNLKNTISKMGTSDSNIFTKEQLLKEVYEVEWYRALAYMKNKEVKKAKTILKSISNSESPYASEASRILNDVY